MEYIEIVVTTPQESKEAIINRLSDMGSLGFIEQDGQITGYFEAGQSPEEVCDELMRFKPVLESAGLDASFSASCGILPERDWNEVWKKDFTPIDVGENLAIIPSWIKSDTDRIAVIIDPGMVFGTGHHETTRTCLRLIEKTARHSNKGRFLDIGTGTGILAIGAARLGFKQVVAVDIDPLAIDAATRNAEANGLGNIEVIEGAITTVSGTFDAIAANLLVEILVGIAPELSSRLNPGGAAILSGLLTGQEEAVIEAMSAAGLTLLEKVLDGKWVSLVMKK